jgi:glycosyltransferase involved in cell wall biosynthesis
MTGRFEERPGSGGEGPCANRVALDVRPLQMSSRFQGTGVYGTNLVRQLMRIDTENEYVLLRRSGLAGPDLNCPPNFRFESLRRFHDQDRRLLPLLDQVLTPLDLARTRAHLYHALSIHYCCWRLPCPGVVTILDMIPLVFPSAYLRTGIKHRLLYRFARGADRILTPSEHARREVHRLLGIPLGRITVTHFAADERFRPVPDPRQVDAVLERYGIRRPFVLYAGGFTQKDPRKNVIRLVEAYSELRKQAGLERYSLVLAGEPGPYSEALAGEMSRAGLLHGVRFPGHVDHGDLPFLYNGASCFVFPSSYEGFGMPPLEAISCGTPTVVYDNTSMPEVVGEGGIRVDEQDARALPEAIRAVLTRPGLASALREKGLRQARKFDWARTARLTREAYLEVWERRGRGGRPGWAARL